MQTISRLIGVSLLSVLCTVIGCSGDDDVGSSATEGTTEPTTTTGDATTTEGTTEGTTDGTTEGATEGTTDGTMGGTTTTTTGETTGDSTTTTGDTTTTTGDTTTTTTTGGGACEPSGDDDACVSCTKESCCDEFEACTEDEGCVCWLQCLAEGGDQAQCFGTCGQNAAFFTLGACVQGSCGMDCG
jgi:hypothetical protein